MNTTAPGTENHRVKTALRVIEIIEIFSREQKPLSLSELARELNAPASSCLALVRTLLSLGYLYETARRQGYYPTGRLLAMAQRITKADPVLERLYPSLRELCAITGETVVLAKLTSLNTVLYLDVIASENPIHYVAVAGEQKEIHANSLGKALFSALDEPAQLALLDKLTFNKRNNRTLITREAFLEDIRQGREKGLFTNLGESMIDVGAIAWPVTVSGGQYAISIAGPLYRIEANLQNHAQKLRVMCTFIEQH
ncbi:IclR family transcriptional regulator [Advenella kashmirensis W13003]|uniref:IclR family transcriptional regulator n=1 Tax=Advenella kashmirensis W13003 TaxID=1424334 RepID=V8QS02_9BURK|nr:IclR family transcriptional regulator [Advenella kashmirensis]ETF02761.1 IclR family transcriptional regulator [Advenella kashmirensis W13003]